MITILSPSSLAIKLFFSILTLLFFIKLISFIRGFKEMGFLIRTIMVVASDIVYFLIVLILFITMIALSSKYYLKIKDSKRFVEVEEEKGEVYLI